MHVHQALSRVFSWALQEELVDTTPFAGLKAPGRAGSSDRVLSAEELRNATPEQAARASVSLLRMKHDLFLRRA